MLWHVINYPRSRYLILAFKSWYHDGCSTLIEHGDNWQLFYVVMSRLQITADSAHLFILFYSDVIMFPK